MQFVFQIFDQLRIIFSWGRKRCLFWLRHQNCKNSRL